LDQRLAATRVRIIGKGLRCRSAYRRGIILGHRFDRGIADIRVRYEPDAFLKAKFRYLFSIFQCLHTLAYKTLSRLALPGEHLVVHLIGHRVVENGQCLGCGQQPPRRAYRIAFPST